MSTKNEAEQESRRVTPPGPAPTAFYSGLADERSAGAAPTDYRNSLLRFAAVVADTSNDPHLVRDANALLARLASEGTDR